LSFSHGYISIPGLHPQQQAALLAFERRQANRNRETALSNPQRVNTVLTTAAAPPPSPSGLSLTPNVGTLTVQWNAVPVSVLYYEIQVSKEEHMGDSTTYRRSETTYTHTEGNTNDTFYMRVRAVSDSGISDWSQILNSQTGNADYLDLAQGAATQIVSDTLMQFSPASVSTLITASPQTISTKTINITTVPGSLLSPRFTLVFIWSCKTLDTGAAAVVPTVIFQIFVDGTLVDEAVNDWISCPNVGFATQYFTTLAGLGVDIALNDGDHAIDFLTTVIPGGGANDLILEPFRLNVSLVEYRN
jgi:hypothetical protein